MVEHFIFVLIHIMEKLSFNYSLKNIPLPDKRSYQLELIEKIESILKRMRWKVHFFLLKENQLPETLKTYGFKSSNHPPQITLFDEFKKDLYGTVTSIKCHNVNNNFQEKLELDISKIRSLANMFIFADKTNNIYEMKPQDHKKLIMENITKTYQKATDKLEKAINMEAKNIAKSCKLAERIDRLPKPETFITLNDHKDAFFNKSSCRLINPTKNELGKISKKIIEQINQEILKKTNVNQWKNTSNVINWFNNIENKKDCSFIQFDINQFHPSITEEILEKAISFAKSLMDIDDHKIRTIKHCRKSLLFHNNVAWKKKTTTSCFDVTIGSYDGAEVCELVGTFILSKLEISLAKRTQVFTVTTN